MKSQLLSLKYSFRTFLIIGFSTLFIACSSDDGGGTIADDDPIGNPSGNDPDRLPQISINTNAATIVDEPKINASMTISENGTLTFDGNIGIEIRGASSQALFPKKSYGLETRDAANMDLDVSLLGLPEEEDWILYGPYSDKSLVRNKLIYDLSQDMNRYASRTKFVELNINGVFQGTYVFMEKLKRDDVRIAISKLNEDENTGEDLTGGYILKIDKTSGNTLGGGINDQNSFTSVYTPPNASFGQQIDFQYEYPKAEVITLEQKNYISSYVANFEDALQADTFTDPVVGYEAYIDVDSFIDFFLLNELSNNVDGYRLSTYMHKDKNEKLKMGPIWDFNLAFGNADYCNGGETNVWAYRFNERCSTDTWLVPFWWSRFMEDPAFVSKLQNRWSMLRGSVLAEANIMAKIDAYIADLEAAKAVDKNFSTWFVLGAYVWPNNFVGDTYEDETGYLKDWIQARLIWMDGAIGDL